MPPKKSASSGSSGKKAPVKRKLAEEFPPGEVLTDTAKRQWKLGPPAGQGGFGRLYLANENSLKAVEQDAPYVIKVEPIENGPLFSELKFYMRVAKADMIQNWVNIHNLDYLGVPRYWGSGIHKKSGNSYRFMVMDRFGKDLQKLLVDCGKRFPHKTVLQLGLRLIDILEYIHEHEYVHGDIKASNILLDYKHPDQVFLVDYGLCYRYCVDGVHKEYKEDPRRCHNGTIEFTSVDAHKGVNPSRRGDLEILGYCMIQWLCGKLPWEDNLMDPNYVSNSKIRYCDEVPMLMDTCFPGKKKPAELRKYMMEITQLAYDAKPSYDKLRDILLQGLKALGGKKDGKLDFPVTQNGHSPAKDRKRKLTILDDDEEEEEEEEEMVKSPKGRRTKAVTKPAATRGKAVAKPAATRGKAVTKPAATRGKAVTKPAATRGKAVAKPEEPRARGRGRAVKT